MRLDSWLACMYVQILVNCIVKYFCVMSNQVAIFSPPPRCRTDTHVDSALLSNVLAGVEANCAH